MGEELALSALRPGESARLQRIERTDALRRRLRELGFIEGAALRCVCRSPGGGLAAYAVGGSVFALRDGDAAQLTVVKGGSL